MSFSRRSKAEDRKGRLTNTTIAGLEPETWKPPVSCRTKLITTVIDQRSAGTGTVDSEVSIADAVDEDCDSDASNATYPHMQRGSGDPEKGLDSIPLFIERNPDKVAWTLEWRERVLHSQEATQVTSYRQQRTAKMRRHASLELAIEQIRQRYRDHEMILEEEIVKHKERHKLAIEQLEKEESEEGYYAAEWWEVESDYQPTECGDGSR